MESQNPQRFTFNFPAYWKFFDIGLQNTFVYRWNFLLRSVFGIVPLIGTVFLWQAVFASSSGPIAGYEYSSMIFYFLLTVFVDQLITPTEDEWQIAAEIRDGKISAYLIKPMNFLGYRIALYLSYRLLYIGVVIVPIVILAWVFREHLHFPEHGITWLAFAVSTAMAAGIQFLICYSLAMIAFWVLEVSTIIFILYSFEYFLSGHVFPLDIMPAWLQGFLHWSPFTYEIFFPVQVCMERVAGRALIEGLCIQAGWLLLTYVAARVLWLRGVRKYQAVGG
ncbi:MAG: viologen exporter family transport system permease protein [Chthoniobacter sp.]|nr:viologen exporter family transport system permease protein [Chthoniobacter sp.]